MPKKSSSSSSDLSSVVLDTTLNKKTPAVETTHQVVVEEKKTKKQKKTSEVKSVVEESIKPKEVVEVVEVVPLTTTDNEVVIDDKYNNVRKMYYDFTVKLNELSSLVVAIKNEFKVLEKKTSKEIKISQKKYKHKNKSGIRAPSGFVKPTKISDELALFLGKDKGVEMARTEVTSEINKYIRANNLQNKENGRHIIPDAKLTALLKLEKNDELTYFNLQKYMSPHFQKIVKA